MRIEELTKKLGRVKDVIGAATAKEEPQPASDQVADQGRQSAGDDSPGGGDFVPLSRPASMPSAGRKSKGGAS